MDWKLILARIFWSPLIVVGVVARMSFGALLTGWKMGWQWSLYYKS